MELFKLLGTIAVDTEEADQAIDGTTEKASSFGEKLKSGIGTAAKWGTAIVAGAGAAATAMTKFATKSASTADTIDKMSQKIGISRTAYQELDFICSQSGTSVDGLQAGMKTLTKAMEGAAEGTESNAEAFERLGVEVVNADGTLRSQEEVLFDTLNALQEVENQTEKAALASELFGRAGTELMPLLNGATGSIEAMRDQAHSLGLVMGDDLINNGVKLTDTLDQTKRAFGAIGTEVGGALMPILTQVLEFVQGALPTIQGMISQITPILVSLFETLLPPLLDLGSTLFPTLINVITEIIPLMTSIMEAILPVIIELVNTIIPPLMDILEAILPVIIELINTLLPIFQQVIELLNPILQLAIDLFIPIVDLITSALTPLIETAGKLISSILQVIQPILETLIDTVGVVLTPVIEALEPIITALTESLSPLFDAFNALIELIFKPLAPILEGLASLLSGAFGQALQLVMDMVAPFMDIFNGLIEFISGVFTLNWEKAWNGVVDIFKGIINLIPSAIEWAINAVIWVINGIISGINWATDWLGIPAIPEIPKVTLPKLEKGGVLEEGQIGLLEGNGAEAVVPLENNAKWIHSVAMDMADQGIGGGNEAVSVLSEILSMLKEIKEGIAELPDPIVDAMSSNLTLSVNNREFARLVKAVN